MYAQNLTRERFAAATGAALAGAALFATGSFHSFAEIGAAGLLMAAVAEDVRTRRIPNRLTGFGIAAALVHALWTAGPAGLASAVAGALLGLAVLWVPFALRLVGAGDVKAVMAVGAFFGPAELEGLLAASLLVGAGFALLTLVFEGGLRELAVRWHASLASLRSGRPTYFGPAAGSTAASGLPFGVALALGVAAHTGGATWTF